MMAASGGTNSQALKVVGFLHTIKARKSQVFSSPAFCKFDQSKCRTAKLCILIGVDYKIDKIKRKKC